MAMVTPMLPVPWASLATGMAVTALCLWLGIPFARRIGWVDRPSARKRHRMPTPLIGGLAMCVGYVPALLLQLQWEPKAWDVFLTSAGIGLIVGYLDDWENIRARIRFLLEFGIAALITWMGGTVVHTLGDLLGLGETVLGVWAVPFTMICIVGVINAVNMSDGSDGQAGGQSLVSLLLLFGLAAHAGRWVEAWWIMISVSVLVPFLFVNAPLAPGRAARVFMGDAGSMFLGVTLAWFAIILSQGPVPAFAPVTALWLVAVPLIDMFSSILRRLLDRRPPFDPDLGHMHHLLGCMGFGKGRVFLIMTGLTALFGLTGIAAWLAGVPDAWMFYGLLAIFAGYCRISIRFWRRHGNC